VAAEFGTDFKINPDKLKDYWWNIHGNKFIFEGYVAIIILKPVVRLIYILFSINFNKKVGKKYV